MVKCSFPQACLHCRVYQSVNLLFSKGFFSLPRNTVDTAFHHLHCFRTFFAPDLSYAEVFYLPLSLYSGPVSKLGSIVTTPSF